MGMSYKAAWQAVEMMNNLSKQPLVERQSGGRHGGGTILTRHGHRTIALYRHLERERELILARFDTIVDNFDQYYILIRRFNMQTSARNQFIGTVKSIKAGPINAEIILDIGGGDELVAVITRDSVEHLALVVGMETYALIKAPWVILTTDLNLKTSARNQLRGIIASCHKGTVNTEVMVELPGGKTVVSIITNESAARMELKVGQPACALIKSSHVILAINS